MHQLNLPNGLALLQFHKAAKQKGPKAKSQKTSVCSSLALVCKQ